MDFTKILQQEIGKKKKLIQKSKSTGSKEYVKTSDLLDLEYEETIKQRNLKQQRRLENLKRKRQKYINDDGSRSHSESNGSDDEDIDELESNKKQKREDVVKAQNELRLLKQPIRKYGESDDDIIKRLDDVKSRPNDGEPEELKDPFDSNDAFLEQKDKKVEDDSTDLSEEPKYTPTEKPIPDVKLTIAESLKINKEDIRDNLEKVNMQLRNYILYILSEWTQQSEDTDLILETKRWLVALLVQLKGNKLPPSQSITLATIFYNVQQDDFLQANESYMKLSIGNVAWPIGVINVGIHSRSAHSRLTGNGEELSNIMKDEKTRRWILGVKRLITFVEKHS